VVLAGIVGRFMDLEGDDFGVKRMFCYWDALACGVVFVNLEDAGATTD
jgi:hypothetical protein